MTGGIETAKLDWEANAPRSVFFGDIYFSGDGAAEARHVFVDGNDLERRFAGAQRFTIGELGFGTGLNILVASDLWIRTKKPQGARLHFLSFEKHPLTAGDLARAHRAWPQFAPISARLRADYPMIAPGLHRLRLADDIDLTLAFGDARDMLSRVDAKIDAWFLDGFAPSRNPDMWSPAAFAEIAGLSSPGATAATFTVAGDVRRALAGAGFAVEKRAGYGRKREMLAARIDAPPTRSDDAPWCRDGGARTLAPGARIAIIGGGIAGCSLAGELREAGLGATIFDSDGIASGASGNPAGLIMPRLDLGDGPPARFFRSAYFHALQKISEIERGSGEVFFNPCGVLMKAADDEDRDRHERILRENLLPSGAALARRDGLFLQGAGVIDPKRFCALLAGAATIVRRRVVALECAERQVTIVLEDGSREDFDATVIANGRDAARFMQARTLPLVAVLGQIDLFPEAPTPDCAVTFGPYAAPAPGGGLIVGATYEKIDWEAPVATTESATLENIEAVTKALPALARALDAKGSIPRAAVRCQTPDRLPIAGPAPDWSHYGAAYDDLRLGKRRAFPAGLAAPNLFFLTGLGSRGLVTAPLCAAYVVAGLVGAPPAVERSVADALHPARFFIRALRRGRRGASEAGSRKED
jgi:tRNA 5-methylaminomethyl-2-thiouridine biosynthesis bifunctional protein